MYGELQKIRLVNQVALGYMHIHQYFNFLKNILSIMPYLILFLDVNCQKKIIIIKCTK